MTFTKYQHLERLGHDKVGGILEGEVYIFPKIDGTNASVWWEEGKDIQAGSRNRTLSLEFDNAGFYAWVTGSEEALEIRQFCRNHPGVTLYGEWLVTHTLKSYRPDALRNFYVFDVLQRDTHTFMRYEEYSSLIYNGDYNILVIDPLCIAQNPTTDTVQHWVEKNTYLIQDNEGVGEGVVLKNYEWKNHQGNQNWAKFVRNEFKERNGREFGPPRITGDTVVEDVIAQEFVTEVLARKCLAKIVHSIADAEGLTICDDDLEHAPDGPSYATTTGMLETYRHRVIPQLLGRVFNELVEEEMWAIVKKAKFPIINFKLLNRYTTIQIKRVVPELF